MAQKPDNVHLLQGTYRKDRHGDPKTKVPLKPSMPSPPDVVKNDPAALAEWKRITKILGGLGVLKQTDRTLLAQYCVLTSTFERQGAEFPATWHSQLRMVQKELGFTPGSFGKLSVAAEDDDEYSDF